MGRSAQYTTTDSCVRLSIRALAREGFLAPGTTSTWWFKSTRGVEKKLEATAGANLLRLVSGAVEARAGLEWEPVHFGGTRPWLRCPRCSRRCVMVFLHGAFGCRLCLRLVYPSTRQDRHGRIGRRLALVVRRMGGRPGEPPPLARKPRWMRWPTFSRLALEARALEERRLGALLGLSRRHFGNW